MKIQFVTPKRVEKHVKARVNLLKTGKLSFNKRIRKVYDITKDTYFKIGINADNPNDVSLYLQKCQPNDPDARKIHKSGEQLLLTVSFVLDELKVDYANKKYLASLEEVALQGEKFMKISFTSV